MIFICADLNVVQFITLFDFIAYIFESYFCFIRKDLPAEFGRTDEMIEKKSDVMTLVNMFAAHAESLYLVLRIASLSESGVSTRGNETQHI